MPVFYGYVDRQSKEIALADVYRAGINVNRERKGLPPIAQNFANCTEDDQTVMLILEYVAMNSNRMSVDEVIRRNGNPNLCMLLSGVRRATGLESFVSGYCSS